MQKDKTKINMHRKDSIWNTIINVPSELTGYSVQTFVEIRAQVVFWHENKPVCNIEINNLSLTDASIINWDGFNKIIKELVENHFKSLKEKNGTN